MKEWIPPFLKQLELLTWRLGWVITKLGASLNER